MSSDDELRFDEGSGREGGQQQEVVENDDEETCEDVSSSGVVGNSKGDEFAIIPLEYGEEEQYLEEALDAELAEEGNKKVVEDKSDHTTKAQDATNYSQAEDVKNYSQDKDVYNYSQTKDTSNYSEDDLNNSILLSEKFELSFNEGFDELFVEDLTEAEQEVEDSVGSRALCKIDQHYYLSPRLVVRGEYASEVLKLTVKRKATNGTYVDWFMVNTKTKDIVLNVKGEMTYSYDKHQRRKDGAPIGSRCPGGRRWSGHGYLFFFKCSIHE